ncbi:conserved hypothetical protein [Uncinocarpus reesii 1704]|uniref:Xylanolytic transcriptional activator regulatory domain-containing protein n=1 Tax=Uncinocarpus reesii (strain UAMH 1704) TaxID=336963 RepID=C4JY12_UNCRE|nr:uncharacterized protein UREG_07063 [Uncinocarpus reesii 1704]EEP82198.1 conserved hypothetical protein [Uncinocarpus reesii 1704]
MPPFSWRKNIPFVAGVAVCIREMPQPPPRQISPLSNGHPVCKTCSDHKYPCLGYNESANLPATGPQSSPPGDGLGNQGHEASNRRDSTERPRSSPLIPIPGSSQTSPEASTPKETPNPQGPREQSQTLKASESPGSILHTGRPDRMLILEGHSALISSRRTHVPYFRYFGPTAIVPGFKQMVVRVRETKKGNPSTSTDSASSTRSPNVSKTEPRSSIHTASTSSSIQFYDPEDPLPNSEIVTHLCEVFFIHLSCTFPFLQRDLFLRDLAEKQLEPVIVDAVCALAARFSLHPLLTTGSASETNYPHRGDVFAQRAMCAVVDALSCPTVSGVQACLMLAYEQFGSNHDSGLWMYLGISIRMAQDLGLQKLEGLKYNYGRLGLAPKSVGSGQAGRLDEGQASNGTNNNAQISGDPTNLDLEHAKERERVDTFWSLFLVDRIISSGTGRPVTLRDDDVEISFPLQSESSLPNGWPAPFPALIRIIHLYGRVTDLLNAIKEINHVTPETLKQLAGMESDLTGIYQRLSPKLHFNAINFQSYVKVGEGTNFILLHSWFHALIVLVHQPTLLHSFSGRIQQLFPNSRELSMSSAKTIADILAFAELIDAKSFIGTPFTSQPTYIAACAFLMESALFSMPSSRSHTPPLGADMIDQPLMMVTPADGAAVSGQGSNAKYSLLAAAAKENYQRCYKALQSLVAYWEGTKYILTVLDQKSKGIWDPQLYTDEEMNGTVGHSSLGNNQSSQTWRKLSTSKDITLSTAKHEKPNVIDTSNQAINSDSKLGGPSPKNTSQAIGWALTGATGSSQPNLSFLYQMPRTRPDEAATYLPPQYDSYQSVGAQTSPPTPSFCSFSDTKVAYQPGPTPNPPSQLVPNPSPNAPRYSCVGPEAISSSNPSFPLSSSEFTSHHPHTTTSQNPFQDASLNTTPTSYSYSLATAMRTNHRYFTDNSLSDYADLGANIPNMTIESQDIDMNTLQVPGTFPFPLDGEFMPWLEYLPDDILQSKKRPLGLQMEQATDSHDAYSPPSDLDTGYYGATPADGDDVTYPSASEKDFTRRNGGFGDENGGRRSHRSSISSLPGSVVVHPRADTLHGVDDSPPRMLVGSPSSSNKVKAYCFPAHVRDRDSPFRHPSSVRAMQMGDEDSELDALSPSGRTLKARKQRAALRAQSPCMSEMSMSMRSGVASPSSSTKKYYRSPHTRSSQMIVEEEAKKEYPLVLLHCNLLPPSLSLPPRLGTPSAELLREVLPDVYWRRWKVLEDSVVGSGVLRDRGVLISHPQEAYDVLEERLLESLELIRPRLAYGHFLGAEEGKSGNEDESERVVDAGEGAKCHDCGQKVLKDPDGGERKWEVRIYAANGLMRAGAWAAAWKDMEKVDVEVGLWLPMDVKRELERKMLEEETFRMEAELRAVEEEKRQKEVYGESGCPSQEEIDGLVDPFDPDISGDQHQHHGSVPVHDPRSDIGVFSYKGLRTMDFQTVTAKYTRLLLRDPIVTFVAGVILILAIIYAPSRVPTTIAPSTGPSSSPHNVVTVTSYQTPPVYTTTVFASSPASKEWTHSPIIPALTIANNGSRPSGAPIVPAAKIVAAEQPAEPDSALDVGSVLSAHRSPDDEEGKSISAVPPAAPVMDQQSMGLCSRSDGASTAHSKSHKHIETRATVTSFRMPDWWTPGDSPNN